MKKNYKVVALLIALLISSATVGCKAKIEVEEHDDPNGKIAIEINSNTNKEDEKSNEVNSNEANSNETNGNLNLDYKEEYTSKHAGEKIIYKKFNVNEGETFSTLKVYDKNNKLIWDMTTETVADWQFPVNSLLGEYNGNIFFKYSEDVAVLNIKNGKEIHRFKNLGNVLDYLAVDNEGRLYISKNAGIAGIEKVYVYDIKTFASITTLINKSDKYEYMYDDVEEKGNVPYIRYYEFDNNSEQVEVDKFELSVENLIKNGFIKEK